MTKRCENLPELEQYVSSMWKEIEVHPLRAQWEAIGTKCHILVEEFIGGQEVDIDCVVENGEVRFCVISDNFDPIPPYFQEQGGQTPSTLPLGAQQDLRRLLESYVRSHGSHVHGVLHFEAKYDSSRRSATESLNSEALPNPDPYEGKSYVIEVNVRPGSAETHTMVHSVYGVTLGECVVRLALGQPLAPLRLLEQEQRPRMCCASVNVYPTREGVLVSSSIDQSLPGFIRFVPCAPGSAVAPPPKSFGMLAWLVASGASPDEAQDNLKRLMQSIAFRMRDATVLQPDSVEHEASPSK
jgi:biotin carboxylase